MARAAELTKNLTHKPSGDLVIRGVTLFDSQTGSLVPQQRVTVRGDRIAIVERERPIAAPGAQIVDGTDKVLLPGLWDMHALLSAESAFLDIATGVTTARDMGNSIEDLTNLRKQIDAERRSDHVLFPPDSSTAPAHSRGR